MVAHRCHVSARCVGYRYVGIDDVLVGNYLIDAHAGARDPLKFFGGRKGFIVRPAEKSVCISDGCRMFGGIVCDDELDLRERVAQFLGVVGAHMIGAYYNL